MKLKEIENSINAIILERGEGYRENGHILSIEEVGRDCTELKLRGMSFTMWRFSLAPAVKWYIQRVTDLMTWGQYVSMKLLYFWKLETSYLIGKQPRILLSLSPHVK